MQGLPDGRVTVALPDGTHFPASAGSGLVEGGQAIVSLRPERVRVLGGGRRPEVVLPARALQIIYVEIISRLVAGLEGGQEIVLKVPNATDTQRNFVAGGRLEIGWDRPMGWRLASRKKGRGTTMSRKVIGNLRGHRVHSHTDDESHLPITPDEIVEASVSAAEAGASIIHLHARDPETGKPSPRSAAVHAVPAENQQQTNAVMNISTGGGLSMTLEERLEAAHAARPELCSLNMGSMNFGLYHIADKYKQWQQPWEKDYRATRNGIVSNTFGQIERIIAEVGMRYGTKFEFECYDVSHLYTLAHFLDRKLLTPPLFVQTIFGLLVASAPTPRISCTCAERPSDCSATTFSGPSWRRDDQMNFCTMGAIMGGNVRVGIEDSLYIGKGRLASSNAEQVAKIRRIVEELSLEIATP